MCGTPNPNRDYWCTMYKNIGMMDNVQVNYINVTQRGGLFIDNDEDYPSEKHSIEKVKQALKNPINQFNPIIHVEVQGEDKYYGDVVKPNKNSMNRFLKLIQDTVYEIIEQKGTNFTIELKDKNYYTCHCCNRGWGVKDVHEFF